MLNLAASPCERPLPSIQRPRAAALEPIELAYDAVKTRVRPRGPLDRVADRGRGANLYQQRPLCLAPDRSDPSCRGADPVLGRSPGLSGRPTGIARGLLRAGSSRLLGALR
jgi:hypothetical protein